MFDNFMFAFILKKKNQKKKTKTWAVFEEQDQNEKHFSLFVYYHSMRQGS